MGRIGYRRVSTTDQNFDRQELGQLDRLFEDKASGKNTTRPGLTALLGYLRPGDTVVVFSIDRLARNLQDLQSIINEINTRGASVEFLSERLTFANDDDPFAKLQLQMMGAFAEFERKMISKRQREGITKAKEQDQALEASRRRYKGGVPTIDREAVKERLEAGEGVSAIAKALGISRPSVYRIQAELHAC